MERQSEVKGLPLQGAADQKGRGRLRGGFEVVLRIIRGLERWLDAIPAALRVLMGALLISGAQIGYAMFFTSDGPWDARSVLLPEPNVAGAGWTLYLQMATHFATAIEVPLSVASLILSQIATILFWCYFIALLVQWRLGSLLAGAAVVAVLLMPEWVNWGGGGVDSLFMASLLGMLYWAKRPGPPAAFISAVHGGILVSMQFAGLMLVPLGILFSKAIGGEGPLWLQTWRGVERRAIVISLSMIGLVLLVAQSFGGSGDWRYAFPQKWLEPWMAWINEGRFPLEWSSLVSFLEAHRATVGAISALIIVEVGLILAIPWRGPSGFLIRLPFYSVALGLLLIPSLFPGEWTALPLVAAAHGLIILSLVHLIHGFRARAASVVSVTILMGGLFVIASAVSYGSFLLFP